jgi:hypothetical protein
LYREGDDEPRAEEQLLPTEEQLGLAMPSATVYFDNLLA